MTVNTSTPVSQASPELSQFVNRLLENASLSQQATLTEVRRLMQDKTTLFWGDSDILFALDRTFLVNELDDLIDHHGTQRRVTDFL